MHKLNGRQKYIYIYYISCVFAWKQGKNCRGVGGFDPPPGEVVNPLWKSAKLGLGVDFWPSLTPQLNWKLWNTITVLLHRIVKPSFPSSFTLNSLPQSFATLFSDKIHKLWSSILSGFNTSSPKLPPAFKPPELPWFHLATIDEFSALSSSSPDTSGSNPYLTPQTMQISNLFSGFSPQSQISSTYISVHCMVSFLTNLKNVMFILFLKNSTLTKKTYPAALLLQ